MQNASGHSGNSTEQLIRKWSTKSNSSGAEQLRSLKEQLGGGGGGRSAGSMAKGRSSSSSCCSRPQLSFHVQQSDSAIGSSIGGSFSFLPPPPPYRPPKQASGSDGAIGAHGKIPKGQDFTSLLGFDLVRSKRQQSEEEKHEQNKQKEKEKGEKKVEEMPQKISQTTVNGRGEGKSGAGGTAKITTATTMNSKGITRSSTATETPATERLSTTASALMRASQGSSQVSLLLSPSPSAMSFSDFPELQERVQRLHSSRDSLNQQVAVLTQQVSLQRDKIRDLESLLESRRNSREAMTGKAQELAELQHKYLALEREKLEAERRLRLSNSELERLSSFEQSQQEQQPPPQQQSQQQPQPPPPLPIGAAKIPQQPPSKSPSSSVVVQQPTAKQPHHHHQNGGTANGRAANRSELDRLQMAIQRLMADNEQKDSMIQSLRVTLEEQQRRMAINGSLDEPGPFSLQSFDINDQIRRLLMDEDGSNGGGGGSPSPFHLPMAHSSSFPLALCSSQSPHQSSAAIIGHSSSPSGTPPTRQFMPISSSSYSLAHHQQAPLVGFGPSPPNWHVASPPAIPPHLPRTPASPMARQLAAELDELRRSGNVLGLGGVAGPSPFHPPSHHQQPPYSSASLPRCIHSKSNSLGGGFVASSKPPTNGGGVHAHHHHQGPQHSFAESDDETGASSRVSTTIGIGTAGGIPPSGLSANNKNFKRGRRARSTLRSFLDRFAHRGNSLQDLRPTPTTTTTSNRPSPAPALPSASASSGPIPLRPPIRQFVDWDSSKCARWLAELGFEDCGGFGTIRSGRHLLNMNEGEFERDLGIQSGLQRKRLRALLARMERGNEFEAADRMDTNQVMLWLDLIGLPQYRDMFAEHRMDGHLLLALSAQDLLELGIHSALNHASLARGIQFLRSAEFHLHRLERHFQHDSLGRSPIANEVEHWSHGCTLEWLCNVDLAEFTPNLVFSGLHGALMVLEPTFTAESLAEMLQIPVQKTLLRRHLTSQFNALLGQQVVAHKRDVLAQPFVTHLTPSLRIRLAKKGFSLARKKSKSDIFVEPEVRVCPSEANGGGEEMSDV